MGAGLGRAAEAGPQGPESHGQGYGFCSKGSGHSLEGF